MIKRRLVNGTDAGGIAIDDRGLQYGDGLFETMAASDGRIRNFELHLARLEEGCRRLGMPMPSSGSLRGLGAEDTTMRVIEGSIGGR